MLQRNTNVLSCVLSRVRSKFKQLQHAQRKAESVAAATADVVVASAAAAAMDHEHDNSNDNNQRASVAISSYSHVVHPTKSVLVVSALSRPFAFFEQLRSTARASNHAALGKPVAGPMAGPAARPLAEPVL